MHAIGWAAIGMILVALALALGPRLKAGTPARIDERFEVYGTITDPSGSAVPNAAITVRSVESGTRYSTTTDSSGHYSISVPPGEYLIEVNVSGFATVRRRVALRSSQSVGVVMNAPLPTARPEPRGERWPRPVPSPPPLPTAAEPRQPDEQRESQQPAAAAERPQMKMSLTWNVWAEAASARIDFSPLAAVRTNSQYSVVIDLAALPYAGRAGVVAQAPSPYAVRWLLGSTLSNLELRVIAIPDQRYFHPMGDSDRFATLEVNLERLKKAAKDGAAIPADAFAALKANPDSDFSFGRASIKVRTRSKEGLASIAFALWTSSGTPIDEFSMPLCIADDEQARSRLCSGQATQQALTGFDSVRAATDLDSGGRPNASLHFIQLDRDTMVALFRDNTAKKERYASWYLGNSLDGLLKDLETVLKAFDANKDEQALKGSGSALYNLLFPPSGAAKARKRFERFAQNAGGQPGTNFPPSVFVRLTAGRSTPPFLIPLGLLAYPNGSDVEFLGYRFRVQTPLQVQSYEPGARCISDWVVLAPPANDPLTPDEFKSAVERFSAWFSNWKGNPRFFPLTDMPSFSDWLSQSVEDATPTALFVLAHHDSGSLYINTNWRFNAFQIKRQFAAPSLAVINACGDAAPGASQVVQSLNETGVSAIIGTALKVEPFLAGDFFATLSRVIESKQQTTGYPIGLALFDAVKELSNMPSSAPGNRAGLKYGARALAYELLGNGNLLVCSPRMQAATP